MKLHCLGSSSAGNCYILQASDGSLIVECGVHIADIKKELNWRLSHVAGCLVTHKHQDHSKSVSDVLRCGIHVYTHREVIDGCASRFKSLCHELVPMRWNAIRTFRVFPFDVVHADTDGEPCKCYGFVIEHGEMGRLLFVTDTMMLRQRFGGLNHIMIEANYSDETLAGNIAQGAVLPSMRDRLMQSHMELETTAATLEANDLTGVNEVVLLHLSSNNADVARFRQRIMQSCGLPVYVARKGLKIDISKGVY